jgi:hypothetical protein
LPFDLGELAEERTRLYDERTEAGRDLRRHEGHLGSMSAPPDDLPEHELPWTEAVNDLRAAEEAVRQRVMLEKTITDWTALVDRLRGELKEAEAHLAKTKTQLHEMPPAPDLEAAERKVLAAERTNQLIRDAKAYHQTDREVTTARKRVKDLTKKIDKLDQDKAHAISTAKMPIDGLGFDDDGVTFDGLSFKQASSAEQLRVSLAMAIALNPRIRVIRITDGSLLDSDNLALISEMAAEQDFQVWIERVDESGKVGVVIEDGQVRPS